MEGEILKRFILMLIFVSVLMATVLSVTVFAEDDLVAVEELPPENELNCGVYYSALEPFVDDMEGLRACLYENIMACNTSFDISAYRIPRSQANNLAMYIYKDMPEAFHVTNLGYTYRISTDLLVTLNVTYGTTKSEYKSLLNQCDAVADEMTEGLDAPGLTEVDKALILHDRLAVYNEYELSISKEYIYEMVGVFVNRTAVCEGYAQAYAYLLDRVGIRNYYCRSQLIKHGWNIVYLDGVKYHVDVTWDDPTNDRLGRVNHKNFLRSSAGMLNTGHHVEDDPTQYDFDTSPSDTRYDSAYWQNSIASFQVINGKIYYIDSSTSPVKLMQVQDGADKVVLEISGDFKTSMGNWGKKYVLLASDGQDLLYSTPNAIYRYCTLTKTTEKIWTPSISSGTAIFGFSYTDGYLVCVPHTTPNFSATTNKTNQIKKVYSSHSHAHTHTYDNACDTTCNICDQVRTITHSYSNACDTTCNVCGAKRTVGAHKYDNICDATCNECGATRSITHTYDNACDKTCNVCGATRSVPAHVYDHNCDTACNECGATRSTSHTYSNACDTTCNVCGATRTTTHTYSNACDTTCNVCGVYRATEHYTRVTSAATAHTTKNDAKYPFARADGWTVSTNKTKSTTSTYTITANHACTMTLNYKVSSESGYDKMTVKKGSTTLATISGEVEKSTTITLAKGDTVTISYAKDSRTDKGNDCAYFKFSCSCTEVTEVLSKNLNPTCTESVVCSICSTVVKTATGHAYDNACDTTCNNCNLTRSTSHSYTNACDGSCNSCGLTRTPPHVYSNSDDTTCNLCGYVRPAFVKGDVDDDRILDMDDAIHLLFYVNFPDSYPVNQTVDFDGNGRIDADDAIYLLFHVNFPEVYPLH